LKPPMRPGAERFLRLRCAPLLDPLPASGFWLLQTHPLYRSPEIRRRSADLVPLNGHRDRVASAQAQCGDAALHIAASHLIDQCYEHASAAGADGMSNGNRSTVYVYFVGIEPQFAYHTQRLHRERFVEFVEIDVIVLPAGLLPNFTDRVDWGHHHPLGLDAAGGLGHDTDHGLRAQFLGALGAG